MPQRFEAYRVQRNANLADPNFWNNRFKDLDLRLAALELLSTALDAAVATLTAVALQRLNDTFTPLIVDAQTRLNQLGATFSAESITTLTIGTGQKSLILTEETSANYVYTDYVTLRAASDGTKSMLGQVLSFTRATRTLLVNVVSVIGAGTFSDWLIRIGTPPEAGHADRTDNPHMTTAAQVGSYTTAQANAAIAAAIAAIPGVDLSNQLAKASNLSDLPDKNASRANLGLGTLALENSVGTGSFAPNVRATQPQAEAGADSLVLMTPLRVAQELAVLLGTAASAADFRAATANKVITAAAAWSGAARVSLGNLTGNVTLDLNTGINFSGTLTGNVTIQLPNNIKAGQAGSLVLTQDGTGSRTITFAAAWLPLGGVAPLFDTTASRKNYISFQDIGGSQLIYTGGRLQ